MCAYLIYDAENIKGDVTYGDNDAFGISCIRPGKPRPLPSSAYQNVIVNDEDKKNENLNDVDQEKDGNKDDNENIDDVVDDEDADDGDEDGLPPCTAWSAREERRSK